MNLPTQQMSEAARTILSVLAPKLSRVARVAVHFKDNVDTASTDGNIRVIMPRDFLGAPIPEDAPVTLGLLAHEMGHWVQPLNAITEIARTKGAPVWLVNIVLDIHGESFVENVFPAMKVPLQKTRAIVRKRLLTQYRQDLADAVARDDVQGMALNASLIARATVEHPWILPKDHPWPTTKFLTALEGVRIPAWLGHFIDEMFWLFHAADITPGQLPHAFEALLDGFPQLLLKNEPEDGKGGQNQSGANGNDTASEDGGASEENSSEPDNAGDGKESGTDENSDQKDGDVAGGEDAGKDSPDETDDGGGTGSDIEGVDMEDDKRPAYPESDFDALGEMLREEMQQIAQNFRPTPPTLKVIELSAEPPQPEARRLARAIQPRFQSPHAKLEVTAPGRLNRLDLARGAPVPLRMDVKGRESPAIKLVLALDVSGSMFNSRIRSALIAAQAVTLAVKAAGGEVIVILFDGRAFISPKADDSLIWQTVKVLAHHFHGGTSFRFLGEVWRRWPQHQVLLVTDGDSSSIPDSFSADRERTSVILIGLDSDVSAFAARSVYLDDLNRLASVMAMLLPDRRL